MKKSILTILFILSLVYVQAQNCPVITVDAPSSMQEAGKPFQMFAYVNSIGATYNWSISTGTIILGQGTSAITVNTAGDPGSCTATVEVGGLPDSCRNTASATVYIKPGPEKIISITIITGAAINDAVKTFISKTDFKNGKLSQNALVNIYALNAAQFTKIKGMMEKAFETNAVFSFQYKIADMGIAKAALIELVLVKTDY